MNKSKGPLFVIGLVVGIGLGYGGYWWYRQLHVLPATTLAPDVSIQTDNTTTTTPKSTEKPKIVALDLAHFNDKENPYATIVLADEAGKTTTLDTLNGQDATSPNSINLVGNTLSYRKENDIYVYRLGDSAGKKVASIANLISADEAITSFVVAPDSKSVYLLLSNKDSVGFDKQFLTIAAVTTDGKRTNLLEKQNLQFAQFSRIESATANELVLTAGYGDAGAGSINYYLFGISTKTLATLTKTSIFADPFGGATGTLHRELNSAERLLVIDNLDYEAKKENPTLKTDFEAASNKGSLIAYAADGKITTTPIDFSQFLTISDPAPMIQDQPESANNPIQSYLNTGISTVFAYQGQVYVSTSKGTKFQYLGSAGADGTYLYKNNAWQAIDAAAFGTAYAAFLAQGNDERQLNESTSVTNYNSSNSDSPATSIYAYSSATNTYKTLVKGNFSLLGVLKP